MGWGRVKKDAWGMEHGEEEGGEVLLDCCVAGGNKLK